MKRSINVRLIFINRRNPGLIHADAFIGLQVAVDFPGKLLLCFAAFPKISADKVQKFCHCPHLVFFFFPASGIKSWNLSAIQ